MFEDKPMQNQPGKPVAPGPVPPRSTEPEDILGGVDQSAPNTSSAPAPSFQSNTQLPAALRPVERPTMKEPVGNGLRKIVVAVIIATLLIGVFGGAAYYVYTLLRPAIGNQNTANRNVSPLPTGNSNNAVNNANQNSNTNVNVNVNQNVVIPPQPIDTDRDGLTDEEERTYGTSPTEIDTDEDGLTDRDEVKVFNTNPMSPDTDGDTHLDGAEVRAGYDPNGPGRLLEIE